MRNKNYLKRFWAILLAGALCVGLLQMPGVYASEDGTAEVAAESVAENSGDVSGTEAASAENEEADSNTQGTGETAGSEGTTGTGEAVQSAGDGKETTGSTTGDDTEATEENSETDSDPQSSASAAEDVTETTESTSETQGTDETSDGEEEDAAEESSETAAEAEEQEEDSNVGISLMAIPEEGEPVVTSNSSDISMTVELGDVTLIGTDAEVTGWEYTDSKELVITINKSAGEACTVQIDLPMQVYATGYSSTEDSGISSLTFTDLASQSDFEDLMVYTNRSVSTQVGYYATYRSGGEDGTSPSGTWVYVIEASATTCTIAMTLKYDASLWSNVAGTEVLTDNGSAVTISVYEGDTIAAGTVADETVSLTSIKAGTNTMSYRNTLMYYKYGTSSSYVNFSKNLAYLDQSEGVVVQAFIDQWTENTTYLYYTEVTVTVTYPSYTTQDGQNTYYLTLDENGNFKNYSKQMIYFNQTGSYTNETNTLTKTVTYSIIMPTSDTATSTYLSMIPLCLPSDFKGDNETTSGLYNFTDGHVTMTGKASNGSTVTIYDRDIDTITYKSKTYQGSENVTAAETTKSVPVGLPDDAVMLLGGVMIANEGAGESEAKTISMDFDDELLVTDVNLLADTTQENIEVTYTLKDASGEQVDISGKTTWTYTVTNTCYGTSTTGSDLCLALNTSMLPENQQSYYFASISYSIGSIAAQTYMYSASGYASSSSPGNYFGYLADSAMDGDSLGTTIKVTAAGIATFDDIKVTSITNVTTDDSSGYGIQDVSFSSNAVDSGDQITLSGTVFVRGDYTSGNNTILHDIHLGVILPDGVTVGAVTLGSGSVTCTLTPCDGENGHPSYDVGDGYTLYLITPSDSDFYIGYYSIGLDEVSNGSTLDFTLTLTTTQGMANTTLNSYNMLYVWGGDGQTNSPGGTYLAYQKADTYDLNSNDDETDYIGGMASASAVTCRITTTGGSMDETESAAASGSADVSGETYYTIASASATTTYTLSFTNNKSGTATGFVYYIPVPKKDATGGFVSTAEFDYTLSDSDAISVASSAIGADLQYTVYVTTDTSLGTYSAASASGVTWTAAGSYDGDWSEVTMIKVEVSSEIAKDQDLTITVDYSYGGESAQYPYYAGYINTWCSMGTYTYTIGKIKNASVQTTAGKTAMITYVDSVSADVTAEKSNTGSVHTDAADSINIGIDSGFINVQNLKVTGITTSAGMTLTNIDTVTNNAQAMTSSQANTTFALSLALNDGTVLDLSEWSQSSALELGNTKSSSQNNLTLTLYNGDALTESTPLEVTLVLTGTTTDSNTNTVEDVTFTITLTINRVKAGVTASTAIDAGKSYVIFSGSDSVTINQDSAFTAQFSLSYVPSSYETGKTLSFANALPAGTTLLLIDVPVDSSWKEDNSEARTYYSYTVTGSEIDHSISLTDFTQIGSSSSYSIPTESVTIYETLLLIVDFSGCTDKPSAGTVYTVKLNQTGTSGGTNVSPQDGLTCTITSAGTTDSPAARSFSLEWEEAETYSTAASYNTAYSFSYSSTVTGASDAYYIGKKLALVVSDNGSTLPDDAYLSVGGTSYYRNSDGEFIIPLKTLGTSSTSGTVSIELCSSAPKPATLTYALWVSATDDGDTPLMGDDTGKSVEVTYTVAVDPSFEVTGMSTRLVTSTSNALTVDFEYKDFSGCTVTLELQKKESGSYTTSTTDLISVTVDGDTKELSSGVVTLITESITSDETGSATFTLSQSLSGTTTYRLLFKVYDAGGEQIYEIPYNFIVSIE